MPLPQNMSEPDLRRFRTRLCDRKAIHGVCELEERCPFSHCLSWHRRNPYEYAYRPNLCPNVIFCTDGGRMRVTNHCHRGRMCMFAHTKEEQMYHPLVYKTQLCRDWPNCNKHFCPFSHGLAELRNPDTLDFRCLQGPELLEKAMRRLSFVDADDEADQKWGSRSMGSSTNGSVKTEVSPYTSPTNVSSGSLCGIEPPVSPRTAALKNPSMPVRCSPKTPNGRLSELYARGTRKPASHGAVNISPLSSSVYGNHPPIKCSLPRSPDTENYQSDISCYVQALFLALGLDVNSPAFPNQNDTPPAELMPDRSPEYFASSNQGAVYPLHPPTNWNAEQLMYSTSSTPRAVGFDSKENSLFHHGCSFFNSPPDASKGLGSFDLEHDDSQFSFLNIGCENTEHDISKAPVTHPKYLMPDRYLPKLKTRTRFPGCCTSFK